MTELVPGFATKISTDHNAPTQLETLRPVRGLVCAHATALAHVVLTKRYSNVADHRAGQLNARLTDPNDKTSEIVWRHVFRAIRQWLSSQPDKAALKANLQRSEAFAQMLANLEDAMADVDIKTQLAAIQST